MRHHLLREADLPQYRTPGHRQPRSRKDSGKDVIPRYALTPRSPGGMSANMAPGCDDAETGPRAVLAMMAAAPQRPRPLLGPGSRLRKRPVACPGAHDRPAQDHGQFSRHEGVTRR